MSFLDNKYTVWYYAIIKKARARESNDEYVEWHHIIPKSMGGRHTDDNFVQLTYREHFLVHWLLSKMTTGDDQKKMLCALGWMKNKNGVGPRNIAGWQFVVAKKASIVGRKGCISPMKGRLGKDNPLYGRKHRPESIELMTKKKRENGFNISEEHRKRLSDLAKEQIGEKNPFFGKKHSAETRIKMSIAAKNRKRTNVVV